MSKRRRGLKKAVSGANRNDHQDEKPKASSAIRATTRSPLSHAALGIASMMLASGAAAQDTALPQIDVVSEQGNQTYQAIQQTITRLPTPLLDTPQTVNVVTEKVIEERGARTLEEALRSVPGITFAAGEGGQQGDSPIINGFSARGDIYRDGVRDPGWYTRDLFASDRVEVYKGPSAFAFGRGTTGGAINFVSKLPTGASFVDTVVTGYTSAGIRTELDASGKKDNFSWRFAGMGQNIDTQDRDYVSTKRWGAAPSMKVDLTSQTRVTLAYVYQGEDSIPDYGHPYLRQPIYSPATGALTNGGYYGTGQATGPVPIKRSNWFGVFEGPLKDVVDTTTHIATAKIEHDFDKDAKLTNVTRYVQNDRSARPTAPRELGTAAGVVPVPNLYPVTLMTIGRQHFWNETDNTLLVNQTDFVGKAYTGSVQHTYVLGMELMRETRFQQRANGMDDTNLCAPLNASCRTSLAYPIPTAFGGQFDFWNPAQDTEFEKHRLLWLRPDKAEPVLRTARRSAFRPLLDAV